MDNAVALVQAFLRLHGYMTVTEFPVVRPDRHGGQECLTILMCWPFASAAPWDRADLWIIRKQPIGAHCSAFLQMYPT
jgi:hypothetical protein